MQRLRESLLKPRWELDCVDKVSVTPWKPGQVLFSQERRHLAESFFPSKKKEVQQCAVSVPC